jgi:hypothetical protein
MKTRTPSGLDVTMVASVAFLMLKNQMPGLEARRTSTTSARTP